MGSNGTWVDVKTRLLEEEAEELDEIARRNDRSLSAEMRRVLRAHIAEENAARDAEREAQVAK
jgi:Ribbon-helix-helix protein, copG family